MKTYLQGCEGRIYEELVFFPGAKAEGSSVDHQWLKSKVADKFEARIVIQVIQ
jgi:hypothetical protein